VIRLVSRSLVFSCCFLSRKYRAIESPDTVIVKAHFTITVASMRSVTFAIVT